MNQMNQGIDPRIAARFQRDVGFPLEPHLVVLALMGSHSHGTYIPPEDPASIDDVDYMGFAVPPLNYHLGLPRWEHWRMQEDELDVVIYSLEKAMRLLLKSNPNIVGLLWLRDEDYAYRHPLFARLHAARDLFSSQVAADAFSGYAYGQLCRMEAFDLDRIAEYEALTAELEAAGGAVREVLEADTARLHALATAWRLPRPTLERFRSLHKNYFSGYMGEKRKAKVRQYGYDVKNAAHLIRLLRMGKEFVETGRLQVYRTADAEELKAIKRGAWPLERVKAEAEALFHAVKAARGVSTLPAEPDYPRADALLVALHQALLLPTPRGAEMVS